MCLSLQNIDVPLTAAVIAALAAIVQAVVAIVMMLGLRHAARSADAATATLKHAEDTSKRQLRAYVDRSLTTFEGFQATPTLIKFHVRNFGQTPANEVVPRLHYAIVPRTAAGQAQFGGEIGHALVATTISAGAEATYFVTLHPGVWQPHEAALGDGTHVAMFRLELNYRDIFSEPHALGITIASRGFSTAEEAHNHQLTLRTSD